MPLPNGYVIESFGTIDSGVSNSKIDELRLFPVTVGEPLDHGTLIIRVAKGSKESFPWEPMRDIGKHGLVRKKRYESGSILEISYPRSGMDGILKTIYETENLQIVALGRDSHLVIEQMLDRAAPIDQCLSGKMLNDCKRPQTPALGNFADLTMLTSVEFATEDQHEQKVSHAGGLARHH